MKSPQSTTPEHAVLPLSEISRWPLRLRELHQRLRPHFARKEAYQHALLYLQAVLSDIPRKNGWQIAEHARQARPYGMQRLLSAAVWDQDGVRDDVRHLVAQTLRSPWPPQEAHEAPFPVLVLDESGFPKRGRHSAGVAPQYCGLTGRVENCQVGVFLSSVTAVGHALIDRELYLPEDWCSDLPRRHAAHIPDHVCFATKPELAQRMVQRAHAAGLPIGWVVADTVYGHSPDLRSFLQEQGDAYALAVPCTEVVCVQTRTGILLSDVASIAQQALRARDWQRLSPSLGTKGERLFDWARLPLVHAGVADGRHWLVLRRCLDAPHELAYYLVWAPPDTPLPTMVQAIGARWHIEEDLQDGKGLGLDHYEGRSYLGWYRHVTLVLLAAAFLLSITVAPPAAAPPAAVPLLPLTRSEVRHLLARLYFPAPTSAPLVCGWSWWRRTHQYWAGYYHRRRRAKTASACLLSHLAFSWESSREFSWENSLEFVRLALVCVTHLARKECPMNFVSVTQATTRLGIDAKTLRRWLAEAQLSLHHHPHDGRKKGVSSEHLEQLARLHQRSLAPLPSQPPASVAGEGEAVPAALLALPEQLSALHTQLAALQQQVADLTRLLHQPEPAISAAPAQPSRRSKQSPKPAPPAARARPAASATPKPPRKPVHVIPRVEYGAQGHSVVICPKRGLLPFEPDTPEWFAWVAQQDSFRFVGQAGFFTAHHEWRVPKGAWRAHRHIRNHGYHLRLAPTQELTMAVLEQAAEALQAHLT